MHAVSSTKLLKKRNNKSLYCIRTQTTHTHTHTSLRFGRRIRCQMSADRELLELLFWPKRIKQIVEIRRQVKRRRQPRTSWISATQIYSEMDYFTLHSIKIMVCMGHSMHAWEQTMKFFHQAFGAAISFTNKFAAIRLIGAVQSETTHFASKRIRPPAISTDTHWHIHR